MNKLIKEYIFFWMRIHWFSYSHPNPKCFIYQTQTYTNIIKSWKYYLPERNLKRIDSVSDPCQKLCPLRIWYFLRALPVCSLRLCLLFSKNNSLWICLIGLRECCKIHYNKCPESTEFVRSRLHSSEFFLEDSQRCFL